LAEVAVEFKNITKHFPGVKVLEDVSFSIKKGEVHALLGENGAGKSTLLNILHGVYTGYKGDIILNGEKIVFKNTNDAIIHGHISKVHQEINVVRDLTVGQNITLGYEPSFASVVNYHKLNSTVNDILSLLKCDFKSEDMAYCLTAGQMQMVSIARALFHDSNVISLDEPTASLTIRETEILFNIIRELKGRGITIIYVSHRLEEIFQICDRATILRDGTYITTLEVESTDRKTLIRNMVGRNVSAVASRLKESQVKEEVVLEVSELTRKGVFGNMSFKLHRGEILGFSGLVGAGRTEVMRAIFGADKLTSGEIKLKGKAVHIKNSQDALKNGLALLPEERKTQGFINFATNTDNVALSSLNKYMKFGFVNSRIKRDNYKRMTQELQIHPSNPDFLTQNMSGGNQQKVILARWLSTDADIFIFDEPTKGVDIAAKAEIYRLMEEIVMSGKSIILVSSEMPEVMGMSDRIIVMSEGQITTELKREEFSEQTLLRYAIGGTNNA